MSLMAEWLEQASQWHEMYCHDLEVKSSNPVRVELEVRRTFVLSRAWTKNIYLKLQTRQKLILLYLFTDLFPKYFPQFSE